jgi:hypothetical protein
VTYIEVGRDGYRRAVTICTVQDNRGAAGGAGVAERRGPVDLADWMVGAG